MPTTSTIILALFLIIAVVALIAWRAARRPGEGEPASDDPDQQAQRPIWRPEQSE